MRTLRLAVWVLAAALVAVPGHRRGRDADEREAVR